MVASVGATDGETLGRGESEGTAVECLVGIAVGDASAEGEETMSVGR
jgi:hypothetical protein